MDGILGDDGLFFTSRNGTAEPLYGIAATTQTTLTLNGDQQDTVINVTGALNKAADLEPFYIGHNDVVYGGLGSDFIHGGAGDDAMSGAEALAFYYVRAIRWRCWRCWSSTTSRGTCSSTASATRRSSATSTRTTRGARSCRWWAECRSSSCSTSGSLRRRARANAVVDDGRDVLFGDVGHDWLVGGTNRDILFGGYGDDLLQADDDLDSTFGTADPLANDTPDARTATTGPPSFGDIAFGGAGRDRLIANTFTDRLYDLREFDSFYVPFAAFGNPTVNRSLPPGAEEYLYTLSRANGADRTRGIAARNGEPFGELGLVTNADADWGDQNGAPSDPQPGNRPGQRDTGLDRGVRDLDRRRQRLGDAAVRRRRDRHGGRHGHDGRLGPGDAVGCPATSTVTVTVSTAPGTALAGSDYQSRTATLTFAPGVTQVPFSINIVNNNTTEPTEQFSVVLSNPSGATIAGSHGDVTIMDDDGAPVALVATEAAPHPASAEPLSADDVSAALDSAREVWTRTGRDTSSLDAITVVVADLPDATLARGGRQRDPARRRCGRLGLGDRRCARRRTDRPRDGARRTSSATSWA